MHASKIFFWLVISLFLFQNCESNEDSPTESAFQGREIEPGLVELGKLDTEKLFIIYLEERYSNLTIDNGMIVESEQEEWVSHCLKLEKLSALKSLLDDISLCQRSNDLAEDQMCAMVYTFPFAKVFIENENSARSVGERVNSCPKEVIEFCNNDEELEKFIMDLDFTQDFEFCEEGKTPVTSDLPASSF